MYLRAKILPFTENLSALVVDAQQSYNISKRAAQTVLYLPLIIIISYLFLILLPFSRPAALWACEENHPVELITVVAFFVAAITGLTLSVKLKKHHAPFLLTTFYLLFSLGAMLVAFEEIAWGQTFIGFKTPDFWKNINVQGETTLHNIRQLQGHSELFRLAFGMGALLGVGLSFISGFRAIASPRVLIFWIFIITVHATVDVYNDYIPIQKQFDAYMQRTSELIEMMIGICSFLYIHLNSRMLHRKKLYSMSKIS